MNETTNPSESTNATTINAVDETESNGADITSTHTSEASTTSSAQNQTTTESTRSQISKSPFKAITVESIKALERESQQSDGKTVYSDTFKTVHSFTDASAIQNSLNTLNNEKWEITPSGQWAKLIPARANRYAVVMRCKNGRQLAVNLHYTSSETTCYVAVAEFSEDISYDEYVKQNINKDVFDRYIITKTAGQILLNFYGQ